MGRCRTTMRTPATGAPGLDEASSSTENRQSSNLNQPFTGIMPITLMTSLVGVRGHVFIALLISTLVCVTGFWLTIPPTYLTNDDVAIRRAIEGLTAPGASPTGYVLMATHVREESDDP